MEAKDASVHTVAAHKSVLTDPELDWKDTSDFEANRRGFIAELLDSTIKTQDGTCAWDLCQYDFLKEETAPFTVNPSLWRQARLNMFSGLFQVTDRIYQVRGIDISVISFIQGDTGYIVIDPCIATECAASALALVRKHLGDRPVVGVIYTHSHLDHFGGVKGIITEEEVKSKKVEVIAPVGFLEAAVSENIMCGAVMGSRAAYMYGVRLPKGAKGQVDAGLGKTTSTGTISLIEPSTTITHTGQQVTLDGVQIEFQLTPDTEAPAEMNFYFPQFRALCIAENCCHTLHNLYTPRGAQVRDSKAWAFYINEAIDLFCSRSDLIFASHHWPTWGQQECIEYLHKQRDLYKYIHDETLRLANHGYKMHEIAEMVKLPPGLSKHWYNRGYYGTVNHNVKAVYQRYLGFFDGNPATLHSLPPIESSKRYVEFMGGSEAVLAKAKEYFNRGEYRWVAEVVNHVVFAEPDNMAARQFQADTLEQLGYQAESAPWRNFYLTAALELRGGLPEKSGIRLSMDLLKHMTIEHFLDMMAVRLNGPKAAAVTLSLNFIFADTDTKFLVQVKDGVLNHFKNRQDEKAGATVTFTQESWYKLILKAQTLQELIAAGKVTVQGNPMLLGQLFSLLDQFDHPFGIALPNQPSH